MPEHILKYKDLFELENNPISGKRSILVVGTFNGNIIGNNAKWFYGRPGNEFWCLFPRMLGDETLHPVDRNEDIDSLVEIWKKYCEKKSVVIIDMFKDVLVEIESHADAELERLNANQVISFDFANAFINVEFETVAFTWKSPGKGIIKEMKRQYINYFEGKGSRILQLTSPSNAAPCNRWDKLNSWKSAYLNE